MSIAYDKVLLILLGVIVLIVAIYFYSIYISPQTTNCEICKELLVSWCTHCNLTASTNTKIPSYICECASKCNLIPCSGDQSCNDLRESCIPFVTLL